MPELPEVERARRLAERHLVGHRIVRVHTVADDIVFSGVTPRRFAARLSRASVVASHRRGKYLWLELAEPPHPVFHFGMTGSFQRYREMKERPRHWKVELVMEHGVRLAMPNVRRLGRIRLLEDPLNQPPINRLGFDPLVNLPSVQLFTEQFAARKAPIKAVLLDQSVAAGVGNWIADEVLYQAGIDPRRRANKLHPSELKTLRAKLKMVVAKAVAVDADKDRFPRGWLFHVRWGKNPRAQTVEGHPVKFTTVGGRTTAFVPKVQR